MSPSSICILSPILIVDKQGGWSGLGNWPWKLCMYLGRTTWQLMPCHVLGLSVSMKRPHPPQYMMWVMLPFVPSWWIGCIVLHPMWIWTGVWQLRGQAWQPRAPCSLWPARSVMPCTLTLMSLQSSPTGITGVGSVAISGLCPLWYRATPWRSWPEFGRDWCVFGMVACPAGFLGECGHGALVSCTCVGCLAGQF